MLIPTDLYDRIDEIIDRLYVDFTYRILGKEFLTVEQQYQVEALGLLVGGRPLLELVYLLVKQRSERRYQTDKTLTQLLEEIAATGILGPMNDLSAATLESAYVGFSEAIERSKTQIKDVIKTAITNANRNTQNVFRLKPPGSITEQIEEENSQLGLLLGAIALGLGKAQGVFERDATSELTNLVNNGAVDYAIEKYGLDSINEIWCYKSVVLDNRTSDHCKKWYLTKDLSKPRVYRLSDLIMNGTNEGKSRWEWRPVCGPDHPRCRSQLIIIGPDLNTFKKPYGFGLGIGENHNTPSKT